MNGLGRRINAVLVASTLLVGLMPHVARSPSSLAGAEGLAAIDQQALAAQAVFDVMPLVGVEPKAAVSRSVCVTMPRCATSAEAARAIRLFEIPLRELAYLRPFSVALEQVIRKPRFASLVALAVGLWRRLRDMIRDHAKRVWVNSAWTPARWIHRWQIGRLYIRQAAAYARGRAYQDAWGAAARVHYRHQLAAERSTSLAAGIATGMMQDDDHLVDDDIARILAKDVKLAQALPIEGRKKLVILSCVRNSKTS